MATVSEERRTPAPPAAPPPPPVRRRLLPSTVLGLSVVILAASLGAAFSGAVLYAYYEYRLSQNENFVETFESRFKDAQEAINQERESAKEEIRKELEPLRKIRAEGETLEALVNQVQPSVWFVTTLDEAGQPSVGSAFVVAADGDRSFLLTSYNTVRAATRKPGPGVTVRKGDEQVTATVHTWQEDKDLALLTIPKGGLPKLGFAPKDPPLKIGERVFTVSGLGASGGSISQGFVADVSANAIQHDAGVGVGFQGGPLLNSKGEVLAVASRVYAPLGFSTDGVYFGVPAAMACEKVLKCPNGGVGAGDRRTG